MPGALKLFVGSVIGPSQWDWETCEFLWGTTADDVRMQVEWAGATPEAIDVEIGVGYGGSVREVMAIGTYLRSLAVPISVRVRAGAYSAHTLLCMFADKGALVLDEVALFMVHQPSLDFAAGTSADLRTAATYLDSEMETMLALYAGRTGKTTDELRAALAFDNYMTAQQALAAGWVDRVEPIHAPAVPEAVATARLTRTKAAVARLRTAAPPVPNPDSAMSKNTRPAAKADKSFGAKVLTALASALGIEDDTATATTHTATAASAALNDGTSLYFDGELAVGTVVYTDEAMATQAAAGDYTLADGRTITVDDAATVTAVAEAVATEDPAADAAAELAAARTANARLTKERDAARARAATAEARLKEVPGSGRPATHQPGGQAFPPSVGAGSESQTAQATAYLAKRLGKK